MTEKKPDVDLAYSLQTPEDNRRLYARWAQTYDADFAARTDFLMPGHVTQLFHERGGEGPVLDAGAGTGLVGQSLAASGKVVTDALDISPEMLAQAASKNVYRRTIEANLLETLPIEDGAYNAVISSGTFTHGHVGPEALDELLRVAGSGALFVLSIKRDHFVERGFESKFEALSGQISNFETVIRAIYGNPDADVHGSDQGLIALFRKL